MVGVPEISTSASLVLRSKVTGTRSTIFDEFVSFSLLNVYKAFATNVSTICHCFPLTFFLIYIAACRKFSLPSMRLALSLNKFIEFLKTIAGCPGVGGVGGVGSGVGTGSGVNTGGVGGTGKDKFLIQKGQESVMYLIVYFLCLSLHRFVIDVC